MRLASRGKMHQPWYNIIFLLPLFFLAATAESNIIVQTTKGAVQGKVIQSASGKDIFAFEAIPYAKPPVGDLRFEPPQTAEPWPGVYDAQKEAPICIQINLIDESLMSGQEDCLYLNVFSTELPSEDSTPQKSVLFWIHGGLFVSGSGIPSLYGPQYLMDKEIVIVTINYRLGILGFMSTADEVCPGNMAMKDQLLALKWVRDNIAAFGGDPNKVTIFGQSAGGASVHYHMLSPASRGLFHRAISQSGSAVHHWAYTDPDVLKIRAQKVAETLGCPKQSTSEMVKCLRSKGAKELTTNNTLREGYIILVAFTPTIEKFGKMPFMTETPLDLARSGKIAPVPWITGNTGMEGGLLAALALYQNSMFLSSLDRNFNKIAPEVFLYQSCTNYTEAVTQKIRKCYFGNNAINNETLPEVLEVLSDGFFNEGSYDAFNLQLPHQVAPMYFYVLTYRGKYSASELKTGSKENFGVCHTDDLQYLLTSNSVPEFKDGEPEKHMSDLMVQFWTDFAETGNPTPDNKFSSSFKWVSASDGNVTYLDLKLNPEMKPGFAFQDRMEFWDTLNLKCED